MSANRVGRRNVLSLGSVGLCHLHWRPTSGELSVLVVATALSLSPDPGEKAGVDLESYVLCLDSNCTPCYTYFLVARFLCCLHMCGMP